MVRRPWPSQPSQRPAPELNEKTAGGVAADTRLGGAGEDGADLVPEPHIGRRTGQERGVLPIGVWSTSSTRRTCPAPTMALQPTSAPGCMARAALAAIFAATALPLRPGRFLAARFVAATAARAATFLAARARPPGRVLTHEPFEIREQYIARHGGFARAGYSRDDHEPAQRHLDVEVRHIVQRDALENEPR